MRCLRPFVLLATMLAAPPVRGDEFVVTGVAEPRPDRLAAALDADDELLMMVGPVTPRASFLAAVADKTVLALAHAGYPDATAAARDADDGEHVLVEVTTGPRVVAADIVVSGFPEEEAADLRRWLSAPRPKANSRPRERRLEDGSVATVWIDDNGQPADLEASLWTPGSAAPCDPHQLPRIRTEAARFLRDRGWYAAARDLESAAGSCSCDVTIDRDAGTATLAITAAAPLRQALLKEIVVDPATAISAAALGEALGVAVGMPVGNIDRLTWRDRLLESGRFTRESVTFREVPGDNSSEVAIVATVAVTPYPLVPPLGTPVSREEAALLRCREWLLATLAEDDLVIHWTRAGEPLPTATFAVSSRDGAILVSGTSTDACGLAVTAGGLACFLPAGDGRCELPLPRTARAVLSVGLSMADGPAAGDRRNSRNLTVGAAVHSRRGPEQAALALAAQLHPAAFLSMAHEDEARTHWEDDVLVIDSRSTEMRIEATTGRPLALRFPGGDRIDIASESGFVAATTAALRRTAGDDRYRPEAPLASLVGFLTHDATAAAARRVSGRFGLDGLTAGWRPLAVTVADHLRRTALGDGFADVDRHLAALVHDDPTAGPLPVIPVAQQPDHPVDPILAVATAVGLAGGRWLEDTVGGGSWPSSLVRIATRLAQRDSATALLEATAFATDSRPGPLAHVVASHALPIPAVAAVFARQGASRLSTEAFRADCEPLLRIGRASGVDRCLVTLLRTLDDAEVRVVGAALVRDPDGMLALVERLRSHASDETAVADLAAALDQWWETSLRRTVATALAAKAGGRVADRPADDAVRRR